MGALADRLRFDGAAGEVLDGPRRYVLMRADVLMGALARLPEPARDAMLAALAESVRDNGADSVRAYLAQAGGDVGALLAAMPAAAADLGWGAWRFDFGPIAGAATGPAPEVHASGSDAASLSLVVRNSPFVSGWRAEGRVDGQDADPRPTAPVCAPITGMLAAVAAALRSAGGLDRRGVDTSVEAVEVRCAATHGGDECRFECRPEARVAPGLDARPPGRTDGVAA